MQKEGRSGMRMRGEKGRRGKRRERGRPSPTPALLLSGLIEYGLLRDMPISCEA